MLFGGAEAIHPDRPLKRDDGAFDGLQHQQREADHNYRPQQHMHPVLRREASLDRENQWDDDMAHDHDDEIGGEIVRSLMREVFAAGRTLVGNFEIGAKHPARVACGAKAAHTALHRF